MSESIDLPVIYNGETIMLKAEILAFGYTYKLNVVINDKVVMFERDENQNYRALVSESLQLGKEDIILIKAAADTLNALDKG